MSTIALFQINPTVLFPSEILTYLFTWASRTQIQYIHFFGDEFRNKVESLALKEQGKVSLLRNKQRYVLSTNG